MRTRSMILAVLLLIAGAERTFGQQPAPKKRPSHLYRTILTAAGGGGGFVLGIFAGIGMFDDSTHATGKIVKTSLAMAAGGAVGGYFLGRTLDRHRQVVYAPGTLRDPLHRNPQHAQLPPGLRDRVLDNLHFGSSERLTSEQQADPR